MRVVICEKAALFREALSTTVTSRGHHVVCCAGDLRDAIAAVEQCEPDVMLLDASMTDSDSLARLGARRARGSAVKVLLLTASGEDRSAGAAVDAGLADGVLDHAVSLATLERAMTERAMTRRLTRAPKPSRTATQRRRADSLLTGRELDVIGLLLAGRSTDGIALALKVSRSTVHSHVQSILRKLGARSRIEAVSIYLGETRPQVRLEL